jgi:hypothetical protein
VRNLEIDVWDEHANLSAIAVTERWIRCQGELLSWVHKILLPENPTNEAREWKPTNILIFQRTC